MPREKPRKCKAHCPLCRRRCRVLKTANGDIYGEPGITHRLHRHDGSKWVGAILVMISHQWPAAEAEKKRRPSQSKKPKGG